MNFPYSPEYGRVKTSIRFFVRYAQLIVLPFDVKAAEISAQIQASLV